MPRRQFRDRLRQLIASVFGRAGLDLQVGTRCHVCLGIAGVSCEYDARVSLPLALDEMRVFDLKKVCCTGDAEIAFFSHSASPTGSAVLSTMGAVSLAVKDMSCVRAGGWGPAFDDPGSGFYLGISALRFVLARFEQCENPSALWKELDRCLQAPHNPTRDVEAGAMLWCRHLAHMSRSSGRRFDSRSTLSSFAHAVIRESGYSLWRAVVSSLAIPVIGLARDGDPDARALLDDAIGALLMQHSWSLNKASMDLNDGPILLYGGVLTHNSFFRERLKSRIASIDSAATVLTVESRGVMRPVCGALLLALGHSTSDEYQLPGTAICAQLRDSQSQWSELSND